MSKKETQSPKKPKKERTTAHGFLTPNEARELTIRGDRNRAARQQALREQLAAHQYIINIAKAHHRLEELEAEMDKARGKFTQGEASRYMATIGSVKQRIDVNFRMLAKVLPDLKAMELSTGNGDPMKTLADIFTEAVERADRSSGA